MESLGLGLDRVLQRRAEDPKADCSRQLSELADIVSWLPEIAAESDLRKPEWEAVCDVADRLEGAVQRLVAALDSGAAEAPVIEVYRTEVADLAAHVDASERSDPRHFSLAPGERQDETASAE